MSDAFVRLAVDLFCPLEQNRKRTFFDYILGFFKKLALLPIPVIILPYLFIKWGLEHIKRKKETGFAQIVHSSKRWKDVDVKQTLFPKTLKFGIASSHYQYGGWSAHPQSQWNNPDVYPLDQECSTPKSLAELTKGGRDLWEEPERVIRTLKNIGVDSFRFSLPEELWDSDEAILRYKGIIEDLRGAGIKPLVTIHHFSHPQDFDFLKNPERLVDFSDRVHEAFGDLVDEWCTINEPSVFAVSAHFRGVFPPCEVNFKKMAELMVALIQCHNTIYTRFKARDPHCIVGFSHDIINFKPYSWWNPVEQILCYFLTHVFSDAYLEFYRAGKFSVKLPFLINYSYIDPNFSKHSGYLDVIQLQCYTRPLLTVLPKPDSVGYPGEAMTHMRFREDPAALHTAMHHIHEVTGKPVSITEFGCTTHSEEQRTRFFERALYAISAAHQEGVPLYSVHGWSFYGDRGEHGAYHEWNEDPKRQDFGLCSYSTEGELFELRPAAESFKDTIIRTKGSKIGL